jgi:hypothetical protein
MDAAAGLEKDKARTGKIAEAIELIRQLDWPSLPIA